MSGGMEESRREERATEALMQSLDLFVRALTFYYDEAFGWQSQDALDFINAELARYGLVLSRKP